MQIVNIERQLVRVELTVPECAALAAACNVQSLEDDEDEALLFTLGAAFQGLGMVALTLGILKTGLGDDLIEHFKGAGLFPEG